MDFEEIYKKLLVICENYPRIHLDVPQDLVDEFFFFLWAQVRYILAIDSDDSE